MRMAPVFLGTTTMPAHHGVGTSTLDMTPIASIRLSSSETFALRGIYGDAARGVQRMRHCVWLQLDLVGIPNPEKRLGNRLQMLSASSGVVLTISSRRLAMLRAVMAGNPRRLFFSPLTMNTCCSYVLPL